MRYTKYLFIIFICIFLCPFSVKASCSYERLADLSRMASNIKLDYNYEINEKGRPEFIVYATNVPNDLYLVENRTRRSVTNGESQLRYSPKGQTVTYKVYSNDVNCIDKEIMVKRIVLPRYNYFSELEDCITYPNFKYCKIWRNTENLTYEVFYSELDKYAKKTSSGDSEFSDNEENIIVNFIKENILLITMLIIGLILIPILIYLKRRM